jgi:raffinose/stachyose/melibiose transport system permease protein
MRQAGATSLFVAPALVPYVVCMALPIILVGWYSLTDWNGFSTTYKYVGLANFREAIHDPAFHRILIVTVLIALGATIVLDIVGLALAIALNGTSRSARLYRGLFFFPIILSPVVVGYMWQTIMNYGGMANIALTKIGLAPHNLLGDPTNAVLSIAFVTVWQSAGFTMVLFIAALQTIPKDIYEAGDMDGATPFERLRFLTIPMLIPAILLNSTLLIIFFMRLYEYVAVMTGGGPGGSSQTVAYAIVQQSLTNNRFGYGSALAVILLGLVATTAFALVTLLQRQEARVSR